MAVSDGSLDTPFDTAQDRPRSDSESPRSSDATERDPTDSGPGVGAAQGGGLRVIDAAGESVGWLVQRGHPFQSQDGQPDVLRDGVLVYGGGLFFGVEMSSGKVLVPRLGIADTQCATPIVAGYYAKGDQVSGMDYGFVYGGKWWRIDAGQPTKLVQCAGVTKQGAAPTCVLHSGTCRGFPVSPVPGGGALPATFKAPLRFAWGASK